MDKVTILLSTYNGERYIREQIDSLLKQSGVEISIIVRDDRSNDLTQSILDEYQAKGLIRWYTGDNLGPAHSFFDLMRSAPLTDYYALCDQDDVWDNDKLIIAVNALKTKESIPALYCSNTRLVNSELHELNVSRKWCTGKFPESLFHTPVTGCTCVFNKQLMHLFRCASPNYVHMHDWWLYVVCTAFNGFVCFDEIPHMSYRQHSNNVIGAHDSRKDYLSHRFSLLFNPSEGTRYKQAKSLLECYEQQLPEDNLNFLNKCIKSRMGIINTLKFAFSNELAGLKPYSSSMYVWKMRILVILRRF